MAIIMDGNGRWAKKQGKMRTFGHQAGVKTVRRIVEASAELGIPYLTLYTFSTENWKRPAFEINALMELLVHTIGRETASLMKNNVRLHAIGNLELLPSKIQARLQKAIEETQNNTGTNLILALSYSSRWEITEAAKSIARKVKAGELLPEAIDEKVFSAHLCTASFPDPELLIRTSGEFRISNYLLWQIAYAELYFTDKLWPELSDEDYYEALLSFQQRERRYGQISEQLANGLKDVVS